MWSYLLIKNTWNLLRTQSCLTVGRIGGTGVNSFLASFFLLNHVGLVMNCERAVQHQKNKNLCWYKF